jgi:hypothetical protein
MPGMQRLDNRKQFFVMNVVVDLRRIHFAGEEGVLK